MEYRFYFDELGTLLCDMDTINSKRTYKGVDALNLLSKTNNYMFTQGSVNKDEVVLYCKGATCVVVGYNTFYKTNILDAAPHTKKSINKVIMKFREIDAKHRRKKLRQLKIIAEKITASALALALMGIGVSQLNKAINKSTLKTPEPVTYSGSIELTQPSVKAYNISDIFEEEVEIEMPQPAIKYSENIDSSVEVFDDSLIEEDIEEVNPVIESEDKNVIYLDFENEFNSVTGQLAYENYYNLVEKYSKKWGLSPNIMFGMLTQESGGVVKDNLMQIQFYSWEGQVVKAYDFEQNKEVRVVCTNNPAPYIEEYGNDIICISEEELREPDANISMACLIFRECFRLMDGHIIAAKQAYNFGCGNMNKLFEITYERTGKYPDLTNQEDTSFLEFTSEISAGDPYYIYHTGRYNVDVDDPYIVQYIDENGTIGTESVSVLPSSLK